MSRPKVVLVGLGALGSEVLLFGRNWKVDWKAIDFDRVEQKNLQAQMHTKMSLGRNKAQSAQQGMAGMFGLRLDAIPHKLTDENVTQLLGDASLILDCTDNIAARSTIQRFAIAKGISTLHSATSASGDFARIVWTEHFVADSEGTEGAPTCEDGVQLPFFGLVGALTAAEAQRFLVDGSKRSFQVAPTSIQRLY